MTSRTLALGAAIFLAGGLALAPATAPPATAHDELVSSVPSSGETLTDLPDAFSITMNEAMLVVPGSQGFALQIQDAAGTYYGDGCVEVVDATMSARPALGEPGEYTMLWQSVSADGHAVSGVIPFTWAPEGAVEPSVGSDEPPVCGVEASPGATSAASATPAPATGEPTAAPDAASGIDPATVLWIGGALLAVGIVIAVAIVLAGRRASP